MGCSVTGRKPVAGPSLPKLTLGPKAEPLTQVDTKFGVSKIIRLVLGTIGGKRLVCVCVCVCVYYVCVCVLCVCYVCVIEKESERKSERARESRIYVNKLYV